MTELSLRKKVVSIMTGWIGLNEKDGSFKPIIDKYNTYTPRPRGVKMTYDLHWCAATVSAAFIEAEMTEIAPVECSCYYMIESYKKIGRWEERDDFVPQIGDIVMYDWDDKGIGDNKGTPDHVGLVSTVKNGSFTVIEGNMSNKVGTRELKVNAKYIRGFCIPDYASLAKNSNAQKKDMTNIEVSILRRGSEGSDVKILQTLLLYYGYDPSGVDGSFGPGCEKALKNFQKDKNLKKDGICGPETWTRLLEG